MDGFYARLLVRGIVASEVQRARARQLSYGPCLRFATLAKCNLTAPLGSMPLSDPRHRLQAGPRHRAHRLGCRRLGAVGRVPAAAGALAHHPPVQRRPAGAYGAPSPFWQNAWPWPARAGLAWGLRVACAARLWQRALPRSLLRLKLQCSFKRLAPFRGYRCGPLLCKIQHKLLRCLRSTTLTVRLLPTLHLARCPRLHACHQPKSTAEGGARYIVRFKDSQPLSAAQVRRTQFVHPPYVCCTTIALCSCYMCATECCAAVSRVSSA